MNILILGGTHFVGKSFVNELIKEYKFLSKDFEELMLSNSELKDYCYGLICEACIIKYDSKELGIDDVEQTDEVLDEL